MDYPDIELESLARVGIMLSGFRLTAFAWSVGEKTEFDARASIQRELRSAKITSKATLSATDAMSEIAGQRRREMSALTPKRTFLQSLPRKRGVAHIAARKSKTGTLTIFNRYLRAGQTRDLIFNLRAEDAISGNPSKIL